MLGGVSGVNGNGSACPCETKSAVAPRAASRFLAATTCHSSDGLVPEFEPLELPEFPEPALSFPAVALFADEPVCEFPFPVPEFEPLELPEFPEPALLFPGVALFADKPVGKFPFTMAATV